jgi:hypothetical protein
MEAHQPQATLKFVTLCWVMITARKNAQKVTLAKENSVPTVTFIMTIEGLLDQPIEAEIAGFSFGSSPAPAVNSGRPPTRVSTREFTIRKVSDQWSPFIQQSWHTGKEMQVAITAVEPIADDRVKSDRVKSVIYSFSNAVIKSVQTSGSGAKGMMETLLFDSDGNDLETPVTGTASYKGSHKGKTK